jgi:hypothetical protein
MNGGMSREMPLSTPQIASVVIKAGTQLIACGCERAVAGVRVLPDSEGQRNPVQAPRFRKGFFISRGLGKGSSYQAVSLWSSALPSLAISEPADIGSSKLYLMVPFAITACHGGARRRAIKPQDIPNSCRVPTISAI